MKPFFVPFPTRALPTFIEEKMVYWNLFHEKFIHYLKNLFSCFVNSQIIAEKKMFTIFILSSVLNECHQVMLLPQSNVSSNCRQKILSFWYQLFSNACEQKFHEFFVWLHHLMMESFKVHQWLHHCTWFKSSQSQLTWLNFYQMVWHILVSPGNNKWHPNRFIMKLLFLLKQLVN